MSTNRKPAKRKRSKKPSRRLEQPLSTLQVKSILESVGGMGNLRITSIHVMKDLFYRRELGVLGMPVERGKTQVTITAETIKPPRLRADQC